MNVEKVKKAHNKTIQYFNDFWINPSPLERDIFYQFLMMNTFINLRLSSDLLSEFWISCNTDIVMLVGEKDFKLFGELRDERFHLYQPLYQELAETPFFRNGSKPTESYEMKAIANFAGSVFNYVEKEYIPVTDAQKHLRFSKICLGLVAVHMGIISLDIEV